MKTVLSVLRTMAFAALVAAGASILAAPAEAGAGECLSQPPPACMDERCSVASCVTSFGDNCIREGFFCQTKSC